MKHINIITGHYGSGKTNIAVNMAVYAKKSIDNNAAGYENFKKVVLIDLDIVNPYFRAADNSEELEQLGIEVTAPVFANTNLDIPSLPSRIYAHLENKETIVFIDVGGDDSGAVALGRYHEYIKSETYDMFYVINQKRILMQNSEDTLLLLRDIESASRLKCTKLINNTHLCCETTPEIIINSFEFARDISEKSGLEIAFNAIEEKFCKNIDAENILPVKIYTKNIFDEKGK